MSGFFCTSKDVISRGQGRYYDIYQYGLLNFFEIIVKVSVWILIQLIVIFVYFYSLQNTRSRSEVLNIPSILDKFDM